MILGILDLLVASLPVVGAIIGVYVKMNSLVIRQDVRITSLQYEIKEIKRHNEKQEEKIATKLDEIDKKLTDFMLHVGRCQNFQVKK